jgi:CheY-like chemotaxis protein
LGEHRYKTGPTSAVDRESRASGEHQRAPRARVLLRVEYRQRGDFAADYAPELGEGGIFVRTDLDLVVGSFISLAISFPGVLDVADVGCIVRQRKSASEASTPDQVGVTVEFVEWRGGDRERVQRLVENIYRPKKSEPKLQRTSGGLRVLLVEDNAFVSDLFRHAIRKFQHERGQPEGHELVTACTGLEALRLLEGPPPDLVILDHYLPGMTGCALVRRIRVTPGLEETPILMISVGGNDIRREALEAGATLYMDKPILLTQLLDTLRALVDQAVSCP